MSIGRLLLAEDDHEMRRLLAATLRNDGYEIVEAANGKEMFDQIASATESGDRVDLVVADIRMPEMTALQVLERLTGSEREAPIVLITAFGDEQTHKRAYDLGAAAVLDKPFDLDDLRSVVLYFQRRRWARERIPPDYSA